MQLDQPYYLQYTPIFVEIYMRSALSILLILIHYQNVHYELKFKEIHLNISPATLYPFRLSLCFLWQSMNFFIVFLFNIGITACSAT